MRIVQAGTEIIDIKDPLLKVERVARVCYKSEDKIKEGSAEKMVRALVKSNHTAMIEHTSLVLEVNLLLFGALKVYRDYIEDSGIKCYLRFTNTDRCLVSGNMRAWREFVQAVGGFADASIAEICMSEKYPIFFDGIDVHTLQSNNFNWAKEVDPETLTGVEEDVHRDISVLFTVDRGVSHEIVRHRDASFAQESTRYCNYGKSGDVTFIKPCFYDENSVDMDNWENICRISEKDYLYCLKAGRTPQEARSILPTSVKTEVVMTANVREWKHFFKLRALGTTGKPHPQMLEVAVPLLAKMKETVKGAFDGLEVQ